MADTKPVVNDVTAPTITKHASSVTAEPDAPTNTDAATSPSKEAKLVSNVAPKIAPLDTTLQANGEQKAEEPAAEVKTDAAAPPEETAKQEVTETHTPASPYEASDSLPDLSEKMTTEMTNEMDSPRIYDTKEYIVPIKDTMHSHGTAGKIIAGIVSALVVVGALLAAVYYLV